jgi:hypothetical protein
MKMFEYFEELIRMAEDPSSDFEDFFLSSIEEYLSEQEKEDNEDD